MQSHLQVTTSLKCLNISFKVVLFRYNYTKTSKSVKHYCKNTCKLLLLFFSLLEENSNYLINCFAFKFLRKITRTSRYFKMIVVLLLLWLQFYRKQKLLKEIIEHPGQGVKRYQMVDNWKVFRSQGPTTRYLSAFFVIQ